MQFTDRSVSNKSEDAASFKLVIYVSRIVRYAEVSVKTHLSVCGPRISVADEACDWMRDGSGKSKAARIPDDPYAVGAVAGVQHALDNVKGAEVNPATAVVITSIKILFVDSTPMAVAAASCEATWLALGVEGKNRPVVGAKDMELPGMPSVQRLLPI